MPATVRISIVALAAVVVAMWVAPPMGDSSF